MFASCRVQGPETGVVVANEMSASVKPQSKVRFECGQDTDGWECR